MICLAKMKRIVVIVAVAAATLVLLKASPWLRQSGDWLESAAAPTVAEGVLGLAAVVKLSGLALEVAFVAPMLVAGLWFAHSRHRCRRPSGVCNGNPGGE